MNSIIEALPELAIAALLAGLFFWLSKDKLSKNVRMKCFGAFAVGMFIWIILLGQSSSVPRQLQVTEPEVSYERPLAELQDSSPEAQTAEQSSERLAQLREAQKQGTSLQTESDTSPAADEEKPESDDQ